MPESNYAALGEGLKLYTDAMRQFLHDRLREESQQGWWDDYVLRKLTRGQRDSLTRAMERDPDKDRLDFLDAGHFVQIVTKNFDGPLVGVFHDFNKTRSLLQQVVTARNEWAHPRTGDHQADDVAHALYAMREILTTAELPEAEQVEALRADVLGMPADGGDGSAAAAQTDRGIRPARAGELPYWWQVCEPHDAFQNPATIDESLFAATLGGVHAGSARDEYKDPDVFFAHTYFTENLKQTIHDIVSRMGGGDGPSVTEMQTPFGGGKTHALLSLYHLITDPETSLGVPGVREALGDLVVPPEARVLVFDGQEASVEPMLKENGASVSTMWGELAFQVDPSLFNRVVIDSDSNGVAPGNAIFRQVLEAASPCLILIDELVSYLVKLRFSNARRSRNLYRQTVQFLQEMFQLAGNTKGVCVLISLPQSRTEFGGIDPEQLNRELAIIPDLQARADRVVSKRTPVNDDEIYTLMSRRLFKRVDPEAASFAARMYQETYERTRGVYDPTVFSADYIEQQVSAYPLHPELIDVLYKKWSTATDFPRTRAVLQLLASVVADQWVNRREAYTIQSAHVDLSRERIRTKVVSAAGAGGGYDAVVAADIIGGDAHADAQDEQRGAEYQRQHIARGIATTLLMHSFGGLSRSGALPLELRLGTVAPNVGPEYVSEVLESLEQSLWYVHREGERLRFQTRPNIYRVISQTADTQPAATVSERLREAGARAMGTQDGFRVLQWAAADGVIADTPEVAIAVLDPKYAVSRENGDAPLVGREQIDQLWEKVGGGLRQWRNALILVAPDRDLWSKAEEAMREVMAYENVIADAEKGSIELSGLELKELGSRAKEKEASLRTSISTAYSWVFYPDEQGLEAISLPVPATGSERIIGRTAKRLSDQDYGHPKVIDRLSAVYFNSRLKPQLWKDDSSPLDLGEMSRRFPQWTYLPILPKREETLRACIREGIKDRLWAVVVGDNATSTYQQLIETPEELDATPVLFDGSASLVTGDLQDLIREELGGAAESADTDVSAVAEESPEDVSAESEAVPSPPKRLRTVRLRIGALDIAKTNNLQPYLFKVLQEQDAGAELTLTVEIRSDVGIPPELLDERIVEAFSQLGIRLEWEAEE